MPEHHEALDLRTDREALLDFLLREYQCPPIDRWSMGREFSSAYDNAVIQACGAHRLWDRMREGKLEVAARIAEQVQITNSSPILETCESKTVREIAQIGRVYLSQAAEVLLSLQPSLWRYRQRPLINYQGWADSLLFWNDSSILERLREHAFVFSPGREVEPRALVADAHKEILSDWQAFSQAQDLTCKLWAKYRGWGAAVILEPPAPADSSNPNDERDDFCYRNLKTKKLCSIRAEVNANPLWEPLTTDQSVSAAAGRFAQRKRLPWPVVR